MVGVGFQGEGYRLPLPTRITSWHGRPVANTDVKNGVLMCRFHHRELHEGAWRIHCEKPGHPNADGALLFVKELGEGIGRQRISRPRCLKPIQLTQINWWNPTATARPRVSRLLARHLGERRINDVQRPDRSVRAESPARAGCCTTSCWSLRATRVPGTREPPHPEHRGRVHGCLGR